MNNDSYELVLAENVLSEETITALSERFDLEGCYSDSGFLYLYFNGEPGLDELATFLSIDPQSIQLKRVKPQNWNALWESNFEEVRIGDFCRIYADFHAGDDDLFTHEILINPQMSFGTGHHATTSMMIETMQNLDFKGKDVLDFGTGTGVLGILARKMGARSLVANDISIHAYENANENIEKNRVGQVELFHGGAEVLPVDRRYDIILANVNRTVLLEESEFLLEAMGKDARLLLSGILRQDEALLLKHYEGLGARLTNRIEKDDWICISLS